MKEIWTRLRNAWRSLLGDPPTTPVATVNVDCREFMGEIRRDMAHGLLRTDESHWPVTEAVAPQLSEDSPWAYNSAWVHLYDYETGQIIVIPSAGEPKRIPVETIEETAARSDS